MSALKTVCKLHSFCHHNIHFFIPISWSPNSISQTLHNKSREIVETDVKMKLWRNARMKLALLALPVFHAKTFCLETLLLEAPSLLFCRHASIGQSAKKSRHHGNGTCFHKSNWVYTSFLFVPHHGSALLHLLSDRLKQIWSSKPIASFKPQVRGQVLLIIVIKSNASWCFKKSFVSFAKSILSSAGREASAARKDARVLWRPYAEVARRSIPPTFPYYRTHAISASSVMT